MNSNSQRNNTDLETSSRDKYQISPKVLGQLEEEGFNTELIQPERQPTFDELVEELKTKGEIIGTHSGFGPIHTLKITSEDYYDWLTTLKKYALTSNVVDSRLVLMINDPWNTGFSHLCINGGINVIGININQVNPPTKLHIKIGEILAEIKYITKFEVATLGRLNNTINNVETISCDILAQGRELTDHRARLDQISEALDNTTQDFIKHEKLHKSQDSEIFKCVLALEKTTSNQFKYTSDEITNLDARLLRHRIQLDQLSEAIDNSTQYFIQHEKLHTELHKRVSSLETTVASRHEIKQVNKMLAEHKTIMEVMSSNIDNNTQMEELLSFEYRKLNSIYLQMEDRITKLETTQQLEIQTMNTYIINLTQRIENMTEREENKTEEINSKMKQLEDKIQDLTQYNEWVLLIIVCKLALIIYLVYKVM